MSKEEILENLASEYSTDFDTIMIWGGKELRELILDAMDDWADLQTAPLNSRITALESEVAGYKKALEEIKEHHLVGESFYINYLELKKIATNTLTQQP